MQQFRVVNFQQHSGDFAGQVGVHALNEGEETFSQHLLLFLEWGGGQHGGCQGLLTWDNQGLAGRLLLNREIYINVKHN